MAIPSIGTSRQDLVKDQYIHKNTGNDIRESLSNRVPVFLCLRESKNIKKMRWILLPPSPAPKCDKHIYTKLNENQRQHIHENATEMSIKISPTERERKPLNLWSCYIPITRKQATIHIARVKVPWRNCLVSKIHGQRNVLLRVFTHLFGHPNLRGVETPQISTWQVPGECASALDCLLG